MSNNRKPSTEEKATLFSQIRKVMELTDEGKREPKQVSTTLQAIIENKQLEVVEPTKLVTVEIIKPLSLLDLRDNYGTGSKGFYDNDWWLDCDFAKEKIEPGTYVVNFEKQLTNKTFQEQCDALPKGWEVPHPTILAAAYFQHLEETGERFLDNFWSRTSEEDSNNCHVDLHSKPDGLYVLFYWGGDQRSKIGMLPFRNLD